MKSKLSFILVSSCMVLIMAVTGCGPARTESGLRTTATVQRGALEINVVADGSIEMPEAVSVYFDTGMFTPPYSTIIRKVYVKKGDQVRQGTMLAKLDDKTQKLAVEAAQYSLELAINNVVQTVCCGVTRGSSYYVDAVALLRFEAAVNEVKDALFHLSNENYFGASSGIALAKYDLEAARNFYTDPKISSLRAELVDVDRLLAESLDFSTALQRLTDSITTMSQVQGLLKQGKYTEAKNLLSSSLGYLGETNRVIKRLSRLQSDYSYPDTCTTLTMVNKVLGDLNDLQKRIGQKDFDMAKYSDMLRLSSHDLEIAAKILGENVDTFKQGLNLKALRDYNISIHTAMISLERAKEALLRTELMAPFDGTIVDINLNEGDMITQRYAVTGLPMENYIIRMVSSRSVKLTGIVDEIDGVQLLIAMKSGRKLAASVTLDAYPGQQFSGDLIFVSPLGALQAGVANYKIEIELRMPGSAILAGGMSATAEIAVDRRDNVLLVPNGAIQGTPGSYWVEVPGGMKDPEKRPVTIGLRSRTHTEIVSGLREGETVALVAARPQAKAAPLK